MTSTRPSPPLPSGRGRRPLYTDVADRILEMVMTEPGPEGGRLPSERELCVVLGVSRVTLRSALALLEVQGVVASSPARGWFVRRRQAPTSAPATSVVVGFSEAASLNGQRVTSHVLAATVRSATLDEADMFTIVPGTLVFDLSRLRFLNGLVIAIDETRIPCALAPHIQERDFTQESLYAALRTARPPVIPTVAEYSVEATTATVKETELLELSPGVPLLLARQRTFDQHGRAFEIGRTTYRGDRYRFRATIGVSTGGADVTQSEEGKRVDR